MDTYTPAASSAKRLAQSAVVRLFHKEHETPSVALAEGAKDTESPSQVVPFCAHEKKAKSASY